jgi:predicted phosphodiesterase
MSEQLEVLPENRSRSAVRRLLGRAGVCLAGGALMAAPYSIANSISNAEVRDDLGLVPTTVSLAPGYSAVDIGILGTVYDESLTRGGIGLRAEIDGPPSIFESIDTNNPTKVVKPLAALYQDPSSAVEGYRSAIEREIRHELFTTELRTAAALGALAFVLTSFGGHMSSNERRRYMLATFGSMSVLSMLAGAHVISEWQQDNTISTENYAVTALSEDEYGTVVASNPLLASIINRAAPLIEEQKQRNEQETDRFVIYARQSIDQQLSNGEFVPPESDEMLVLALSDLHSNRAMIEVYQYFVGQVNKIYGDNTLELTLLVGDQTYGSATEKGAVDAISQIRSDVYGISGNHDGPLIAEQAKSQGITLLNGKTIEATDGLSLLGAPDPTLTKVSALFGLSENTLRDKKIGGQEELGELLAEEAENTDPTFILSHEAYALESLLGKDDISPTTMEEWLSSGGSSDDNIPAGAVLYGHWHRGFDYRIIRDDDGNGTVVAELGTAGGASGEMSLGNLSFPWTIPAKQASAVLMRINTDRQLVTGIQEMITLTSGEVSLQPAETIVQPRDSEEAKSTTDQDDTHAADDKQRRR